MARIEAYKPHGLDLIRRYTFRTAKRMYGRPMEPNEVVAHHKPLMVGVGVTGLALERYSHSVPHRLKHLAMLRTSQLTGCEWCLDFGSMLAQKSGLAPETLRDLSAWRSSAQFDDLDRLVLEYAEGMTRTPVDVPDDLFARLREHFDERQIVELTVAIGLENLYSRSNWALGIHGEGFTDGEGMFCVRPESHAIVAEVATR
jgi:AhpD family alkylhydroperoxidase